MKVLCARCLRAPDRTQVDPSLLHDTYRVQAVCHGQKVEEELTLDRILALPDGTLWLFEEPCDPRFYPAEKPS